jgi:hypothetical protein
MQLGQAVSDVALMCTYCIYIWKAICFSNAQIYKEGAHVSGMRRYISEGAYVSVMCIASI